MGNKVAICELLLEFLMLLLSHFYTPKGQDIYRRCFLGYDVYGGIRLTFLYLFHGLFLLKNLLVFEREAALHEIDLIKLQ